MNLVNKDGINIISLFDGMSCGRLSSERAGLKVDNYLASEIKGFAINHTKEKYANTISIGDVTKVHFANGKLYKNCEKIFALVYDNEANIDKKINATNLTQEEINSYLENGYEVLPDGTICTWNYDNAEVVFEDRIDMLIGGSPCQDFSFANASNGGKYGLEGEKSRLFYEYARLKEEINPTYFLLENVEMKKTSEKMLNEFMGVEGIHVNSKHFAIQQRRRIYWTNIVDKDKFELPMIDEESINFQNYKIMTNKWIENEIYLNTRREFGKSNSIAKLKGIVSKIDSLLFTSEIDVIVNRNYWAYEEYLAAYPNATKREFVNELHYQLCEVQVQKTPSRDKMYYVQCKNITNEKKMSCITRKQDRQNNSGNVDFGDYYRFLTKFELCKGQTVPYAYLCDLTLGQIEDVCGDGWTVDVIAHFFKYLPDSYKIENSGNNLEDSNNINNYSISLIKNESTIINSKESIMEEVKEPIVIVKRRGRKPKNETLTLDEQIEIAAMEVEKATKKLKDLRARQDEEKKQQLIQAFMESGKSFEEIFSFLNTKVS